MARRKISKICQHCGTSFLAKKPEVKCCSKPCAQKIRWGSLDSRLWAQITKLPDAPGCWLWTGLLTGRMGYAKISDNGRTIFVHRLLFERHIGETVPKAYDVCHRCDTPSCVNPSHMFVGTRKDNMADAFGKGRTVRGQKNGRAKLTEVQVIEIRNSTERAEDIARKFHICRQTVSSIKARESWAHL